MNISALMLISFGAVFGIVYLLTYVPIIGKIFGRYYSPRLFLCKFLAPLDISLTLILIGGGIVGLTVVNGISMMIYNVCVGIGISIGVIITRKVMVPRWQKEFQTAKNKYAKGLII